MPSFADALIWLTSPVDPARIHLVDPMISWHARLMVLAWVIIAPVAVLAARFFKIMPGQDWPRVLDNPLWWHIHKRGQIAVGVLTFLAACLAWGATYAGDPAPRHRLLGYLLLTLVALQVCSGFLRGTKGGPTARASDGSLRGDHFDMTPRRLVFEAFHKLVGYSVLALSAVVITLGLDAANAPRWMWIAIFGWWALMILTFAVLQVSRGAADTYQAIWGSDPSYPGNRMRKRGIGTFRPGDKG